MTDFHELSIKMKKHVLTCYPVYDDFEDSIFQRYKASTLDPRLLADLKKALETSAPFKPYYTESDPYKAIIQTLADAGFSGGAAYFAQLSKLTKVVGALIGEYGFSNLNAHVYDNIGKFIQAQADLIHAPKYPNAGMLAKLLAGGAIGIGVLFGANEVIRSPNPSDEFVKQGVLLGIGWAVAMDVALATAIIVPAMPAVAVAAMAAVIAGIAVYAVEQDWTNFVNDAKADFNAFHDATLAAKHFTDIWTGRIMSFFDKTGQEAIDIINRGTSWTDKLFTALEQEFGGGVDAIDDWLTRLYADYTLAITMPISPLVLDLDGDGVELTSLTGTGKNGPVYWDIDNDGFGEASAWVKKDDGLLVMDRNTNGAIDNHSELFGTATTDGFSILKALDTNRDGKISAADTDFAKLRVWRDLNQDGVSQAGELFTLAGLDINSIGLLATDANYFLAGNHVSKESTYTLTNGTTRKIVDAWFNFDNVNSVYKGAYTLNPDVLFLPMLRGYGALPDLSIAMSQKPALLAKVKALAALDLINKPASIMPLVQEIMHLWASADKINIDSRGFGLNARDIKFVEMIFDKPATNMPDGYIGTAERGMMIESIFRDMRMQIAARLLLQGTGQQFFTQAPVYDPVTDSFSGAWNLDFTRINVMPANATPMAIFSHFASLFIILDGSVGLQKLDAATKSKLNALIMRSDASGDLNFDVVANSFLADHIMRGNAGNNTLYNDSRNSLILAGAGSDDVYGNDGDDFIFGGGGNDNLYGGAGVDRIYGEDGDDTLHVNSRDLPFNEILDGGAGNNTLRADNVNLSGAQIKLIRNLEIQGAVTLTSAQLEGFKKLKSIYSHADIRVSSAGTYTLAGKVIIGEVHLYGSSGNDVLTGSTGVDIIHGEDGNDILYGENGNDTLYTSAGVDKLYGGAGNDVIVTGDSREFFELAPGTILDGGAGTNTLRIEGLADITRIKPVSLASLHLTDNSTIVVSSAQLNSFSNISGSGNIGFQTAGTYSLAGKAINGEINFTNWWFQGTGNLVLIGDAHGQRIEGAAGNDTLRGGGGDDEIYGNGGGDIIYGDGGNDTLYGSGFGYQDGADSIYGGAGNDTIVIMDGENCTGDRYDGGAGINTLKIYNEKNITQTMIVNITRLELNSSVLMTAAQWKAFTTITATGYPFEAAIGLSNATTINLGTKTVKGSVSLSGSAGNDFLTGDAKGQMLKGNNGNDTLDGKEGNDDLYGGAGNDRLHGGAGNDTLYGDNFSIGNGNDLVYGGDGNDRLYADGGNDKLYGEAGNDTFYARSWSGAKTLIDGGTGINTLHAMDANISAMTIKRCSALMVANAVTLTGAQFKSFQSIKVDQFYSFGDTNKLIFTTAGNYNLEAIKATDEISLSGSAGNDTLTGNATAQTLEGNGGNDSLNGRSGNDALKGGAGNDTYLFGKSYGIDTIYDTDGARDTVKLGAGIAKDQLWFTRNGNDLAMSIIGTSDKLLIRNWYSGDRYQVEKIQTAGGDILSHAKVAQLVSAMASFTAPTQANLPANYHTQLDPVIDRLWAHS